MFNNQRFATRGIMEQIPVFTQFLLWNLISDMQISAKDYLQVFKLTVENGRQKIIHEQEQPDYKKEYLLRLDEPVNAKIFVIDDEDHSTMLLAEEY